MNEELQKCKNDFVYFTEKFLNCDNFKPSKIQIEIFKNVNCYDKLVIYKGKDALVKWNKYVIYCPYIPLVITERK
jgi:hypothetical protein